MSTPLLLFALLASQTPGPSAPSSAPAPSAAASSRQPAQVPEGPCATPRLAAVAWIGNVQPGNIDAEAALRCVERPAGMGDEDVLAALIKLKRVLDARGIDALREVPDEAGYRDPSTGQHRTRLVGAIANVELARQASGWRFTAASIEAIDGLYEATFPLGLDRIVNGMPPWATRPIFGIAAWQVLFLFVLLILAWAVRTLVAVVVRTQLRRALARFGLDWGGTLMAASLPLGTLAMAGVIALGIPSLALSVKAASIALLSTRILAAIAGVLLVYRITDLFAVFLEARAKKTETKLDDQLVPIIVRSAKTATVVIGVIFVLQNLNVDVGSLLAGLGLGGLAFALAAKDAVGNFFGSVTIFLDKPFQIGDWIVTSGVEGVVEQVGVRSTRIRTFYNSLVTMPNGKFTDAIVDNYGLRQYRRCSIRLGLEYGTKPSQVEAFCDGLRGIIKAHPATRKDYYEVHFAGYGESALEIMVYFFFEVPSWSEELRARHEIYLDFLRLAERLGVNFAFPTRTLHIETQATPTDRTPAPPPDKETLRQAVDAFGPGGDDVVAPGQRVHDGFYAGS